MKEKLLVQIKQLLTNELAECSHLSKHYLWPMLPDDKMALIRYTYGHFLKSIINNPIFFNTRILPKLRVRNDGQVGLMLLIGAEKEDKKNEIAIKISLSVDDIPALKDIMGPAHKDALDALHFRMIK